MATEIPRQKKRGRRGEEQKALLMNIKCIFTLQQHRVRARDVEPRGQRRERERERKCYGDIWRGRVSTKKRPDSRRQITAVRNKREEETESVSSRRTQSERSR